MAHPDIQKFADMLYEAERTRVPIEPLTDMAPSLTADDAYAIQLANVDRYVKEGRIVSGKKIGLTSEGIKNGRCMNLTMGISMPIGTARTEWSAQMS